MQCGKAASLDHLVGDGENARRHLDPKCPRRLNNHRPAGAGEAGGRAAGSVRSTRVFVDVGGGVIEAADGAGLIADIIRL
jgi:hypothetical protein